MTELWSFVNLENCFKERLKFHFQKGGLSPLHIASAIPGEEGVLITELLLKAGADPDIRAEIDDSFLNRNLVSFENLVSKIVIGT